MIQIKVDDSKLKRAMKLFPKLLPRYMQRAGEDSYALLMKVEGLQNYPPETAANSPPPPYYIRGVGTQYASGNRGGSERLGTQWYWKASGQMDTEIGNRASYAQYVHGENQAHHMGPDGAIPKGWKILKEVAVDKVQMITDKYNAWIDHLLRDIDLK